jgi:Cytochrome P460
MIKSTLPRTGLAAGMAAMFSMAALAGGPANTTHEPTYTASDQLIPPADYREWVFLSSGLDMSYNEKANASAEPVFDNVFVNPEAYRAFLRTGTWPDKTQFVLEIRGSSAKGSINHRGHFQSGDVKGLEMHVKDTARFAGGWAFFDIEGGAPAAQMPVTAACYACHRDHGAVDTTFTQFYPTMLPVAKKQATLSAAYLKDEAELAKTVH